MWRHGRSTERAFNYVTSQNLSADQLQQLADQVGQEQDMIAENMTIGGLSSLVAFQSR